MQSLFSLSQYHYYEGSDMTPMKEIELYKNKEIDQMAQRSYSPYWQRLTLIYI